MITIELYGTESIVLLGDRRARRAAIYRSLNRSADGMRTDISSEVRKTFNITKQQVDPFIKVFHCENYDDLNAGVILKPGDKSAIPLIKFGAVERRNLASGSVKTMKGKDGFYSQRLKRQVGQQGVTHKVMKSAGKGFSGNAFIIPGGGGSLQVVRRLKGQKGRFALKEKRVVTVAGMISSTKQDIMARIEAKARERMNINLAREMRYYQDRFEKGMLIGNKGDLYKR